jgi:DNA-binding XRE family transcriptional regulator
MANRTGDGPICKPHVITHTLWKFCHFGLVKRNLDREFALFIRKTRAGLSYAEFAKKVGVSHTTLHRIERGEHHITLNKLETILGRLKLSLKDVFPHEY